MTHQKIYLLVLTAILATVICVSTLMIQIPLPGMGGYANLGDGVLLVSACMLQPGYAAAAAGVGSVLADVLSGYAVYAPGSLVIKGGMALAVSLLSALRFRKKGVEKSAAFVDLIAYVLAELMMAAGYFLYDAIMLSRGMSALVSLPGNLAQGVVGIAAAMILKSVIYGLRKR